MDESQVLEYRTRGGAAELTFEDGSYLFLIPYRNWGNIEGFNSALLYQDGTLEALATDRPSRRVKSEERGFWSRGKITQQQLADYWNVAVQIGEKVFNEFKNGKIDHDLWRSQLKEFWIISDEGQRIRKALENGIVRVFEKNPDRFKERI